MGLSLTYDEGQTPLGEEEKEGLKIKSITTQDELDEFEQLNIEKAVAWTIQSQFQPEKILTEKFIRKVHKKMFGDTWKWAGEFRKSDKNIGSNWTQIAILLKTLIDDTNFWIQNQTYSPEEIAIRFKHRIVSIHCFPNGNGRHSRLMADIIIESYFGKEVFSWHNTKMNKPHKTRKKYIKTLIAADLGDIKPLIDFAKN